MYEQPTSILMVGAIVTVATVVCRRLLHLGGGDYTIGDLLDKIR
jgi:hypothetical protein